MDTLSGLLNAREVVIKIVLIHAALYGAFPLSLHPLFAPAVVFPAGVRPRSASTVCDVIGEGSLSVSFRHGGPNRKPTHADHQPAVFAAGEAGGFSVPWISSLSSRLDMNGVHSWFNRILSHHQLINLSDMNQSSGSFIFLVLSCSFLSFLWPRNALALPCTGSRRRGY